MSSIWVTHPQAEHHGQRSAGSMAAINPPVTEPLDRDAAEYAVRVEAVAELGHAIARRAGERLAEGAVVWPALEAAYVPSACGWTYFQTTSSSVPPAGGNSLRITSTR
jgi:hypothetical protein